MIWWYENGQKKWETDYKNGKWDGNKTVWLKNGQKKSETHYKNGKSDGNSIEWFKNGQKKREEYFIQGLRYGYGIEWYEDGQMRMLSLYNKCGEVDEYTLWKSNGDIRGKVERNETCTEEDINIALKDNEERSKEARKRIYQNLQNLPNWKTDLKGWVDKYGYK